MSWVAVIGGAVTLGSAAIKADAASNAPAGAGGAGMSGGGPPSFSNPSAASYGTTIGNDGWSINFGSGTQIATPSKTTSASYPQQQQNPLTQLQPQYVLPDPGAAPLAGMDSQTLLLLAVGGLVLVKALHK